VAPAADFLRGFLRFQIKINDVLHDAHILDRIYKIHRIENNKTVGIKKSIRATVCVLTLATRGAARPGESNCAVSCAFHNRRDKSALKP
jgi:hypothetical protein